MDAKPTDRDALSQFEVWWRYPVQFALLFFGLVNAGVPFRSLEAGTWGVPIAVILGKPVGIMIAAAGALALGLHLPERLSWRDLTVVGLAAAVSFSIGFTFLPHCCRRVSCDRKRKWASCSVSLPPRWHWLPRSCSASAGSVARCDARRLCRSLRHRQQSNRLLEVLERNRKAMDWDDGLNVEFQAVCDVVVQVLCELVGPREIARIVSGRRVVHVAVQSSFSFGR